MSAASIFFWARLPKAGLGNKLLVWARAQVYAKAHHTSAITTHWVDINWGAIWRRERSMRLYWGYFKPDGFIKRLRFWKQRATNTIHYEPFAETTAPGLYQVTRLFIGPDYFQEFRQDRAWLRNRLIESLRSDIRSAYHEAESPAIALHIRRGDFKFGHDLTPLSFFEAVVRDIRAEMNQVIPVTIFSDAADEELSSLLELEQVQRSANKLDILDMLQLSKAKVLVMSVNSTFSFWAGFLSEGIVVRSPQEYNPPLNRKNTPMPWQEFTYDGTLLRTDWSSCLQTVFSSASHKAS